VWGCCTQYDITPWRSGSATSFQSSLIHCCWIRWWICPSEDWVRRDRLLNLMLICSCGFFLYSLRSTIVLEKKQLYISFFYLYIMVDNLFESISGLFKNDFLKWWRGSAFNGATLELISLQWRIVIVRSHATQIGARMREKFKLEMKIQQLNPIPMGL